MGEQLWFTVAARDQRPIPKGCSSESETVKVF